MSRIRIPAWTFVLQYSIHGCILFPSRRLSLTALYQACTDAEQCGKETTAITFQPELNKTTDSPSSLNRHLVVIVAVPTVCLLVLAIAVPVIIVKGRKGCIDRKQENIIYGVHGSLDSPSISTVSSTNSSNIYSRISENTISESALPKGIHCGN
ncbi:hypothetical protein LSH36_1861g00011 [Paralvinella palmiformis]|uniref:Uncharacterized protein n=1 Tax=Paralvinella palmiformis TaxID=53620 RepID=A0AAD9ISP6_9ANNE|nr:hypothetical protein LSH36_1861g00011 [Paralvinella palmiformis]